MNARTSLSGAWRRNASAPVRAALVLAAVALAVVLVVLPHLQQRVEMAQADADAARLAVLKADRAAASNGPRATDPLKGFRDGLPSQAERQPRVAELLSLADRHGVATPRSEYRYSIEAGLGMARYRVSLPVSGPYGAVRGFLEAAMAADPSLVLDSVRLSRPDANAATLQADLQFSLLMQSGAEAAR